MENKTEIWVKIEGFPTYYVSTFGRVKNTNFNQTKIEKVMKPGFRKGYPCVDLCKNSIKKHSLIHRLVAIAFIPNPEQKPTVNHIDGNKQNNNVSNLEWATSSENNKHAHATGLNRVSEKCRKINSERGRLSGNKVYQYDFNGNFIKEYISQAEAAKQIGIYQANISSCISGKYKSCGGFKWKTEKIENAN